jgi:hypothetical protein
VFLALTTMLAVSAAPSVGEAIGLEWSAPPECPTAADVRAAIDVNLAGEGSAGPWQSVTVRGSIEAVDDAWLLHLRAELPAGSVVRDVESHACAELAEAAGLILAVVLDPLRFAATSKRVAAVGSDAEAAPNLAASPPVASPPKVRRRRPAIDLRLGALGEYGSLGGLRAGVWLGVGVVTRRFRFDLAGEYWGPRRELPFDDAPSAGVSVQLGGVAARGCVIPNDGALTFAACVGVEAGAARGQGVGLDRATLSHPAWVAVVVGPELAWISKHRVGLWVAADAMVHVVRPRWTVRDLGVAAHTAPVGFRLVLGPTVRL